MPTRSDKSLSVQDNPNKKASGSSGRADGGRPRRRAPPRHNALKIGAASAAETLAKSIAERREEHQRNKDDSESTSSSDSSRPDSRPNGEKGTTSSFMVATSKKGTTQPDLLPLSHVSLRISAAQRAAPQSDDAYDLSKTRSKSPSSIRTMYAQREMNQNDSSEYADSDDAPIMSLHRPATAAPKRGPPVSTNGSAAGKQGTALEEQPVYETSSERNIPATSAEHDSSPLSEKPKNDTSVDTEPLEGPQDAPANQTAAMAEQSSESTPAARQGPTLDSKQRTSYLHATTRTRHQIKTDIVVFASPSISQQQIKEALHTIQESWTREHRKITPVLGRPVHGNGAQPARYRGKVEICLDSPHKHYEDAIELAQAIHACYDRDEEVDVAGHRVYIEAQTRATNTSRSATFSLGSTNSKEPCMHLRQTLGRIEAQRRGASPFGAVVTKAYVDGKRLSVTDLEMITSESTEIPPALQIGTWHMEAEFINSSAARSAQPVPMQLLREFLGCRDPLDSATAELSDLCYATVPIYRKSCCLEYDPFSGWKALNRNLGSEKNSDSFKLLVDVSTATADCSEQIYTLLTAETGHHGRVLGEFVSAYVPAKTLRKKAANNRLEIVHYPAELLFSKKRLSAGFSRAAGETPRDTATAMPISSLSKAATVHQRLISSMSQITGDATGGSFSISLPSLGNKTAFNKAKLTPPSLAKHTAAQERLNIFLAILKETLPTQGWSEEELHHVVKVIQQQSSHFQTCKYCCHPHKDESECPALAGNSSYAQRRQIKAREEIYQTLDETRYALTMAEQRRVEEDMRDQCIASLIGATQGAVRRARKADGSNDVKTHQPTDVRERRREKGKIPTEKSKPKATKLKIKTVDKGMHQTVTAKDGSAAPQRQDRRTDRHAESVDSSNVFTHPPTAPTATAVLPLPQTTSSKPVAPQTDQGSDTHQEDSADSHWILVESKSRRRRQRMRREKASAKSGQGTKRNRSPILQSHTENEGSHVEDGKEEIPDQLAMVVYRERTVVESRAKKARIPCESHPPAPPLTDQEADDSDMVARRV